MIEKRSAPLVGVAYYRPPSPPLSEWEGDFRQIKAMGFQVVKIWLYWGWHERKPGVFDWLESDRFFDLAEKNGLLAEPNIIMELPPAWLPIKHRLEGMKGYVERGHFPGLYTPCFDDPEVRRAGEPFIEAVASRYASRKIVHWDVWNEPRSKWTCLCEASRKIYAAWLAKRFGTIEAYNRKFGKCFDTWETVAYYLKGGADYADEFNWRLWAAEQLADQVHWVADIVRHIDKAHPVMCHVGISSPCQSVRCDTCVDALTAEGLDLYGSSFDASWESQAYVTDIENVRPLTAQSNLVRAQIQVDWLRSLSPKNWICELYGNIYNMWETRKPEMLMWQFWQAASRGLGGIMIWEYKVERIGVETLAYGLLGLDGRPNDRSRVLAAAMALLKGELAEFFRDYRFAEPEVGILYDERSHLLAEFEGYYNPKMSGIHQKSIFGLYETLRRSNVPVRLVPHQHLDRVISRLRTLILPGHGYMDKPLADKLKLFVEQGGHLVGLAGTGLRMENTWASTYIPSYGLDELCGVREKARMFAEDPVEILDESGRLIDRVRAFKINLELHGGKAVGWFADGEIAVAERRTGKGTTRYLGGYFGVSESTQNGLMKSSGKPGNRDGGNLLRYLDIARPDAVLDSLAGLGLDVIPWSKSDSPGGADAYFIFNETAETIEFARPRTAANRVTPLCGDINAGSGLVRLSANSIVLVW